MSADKKKVDLANIDWNNSGAWPDGLKFGACGLVIAVILGLFYYVLISGQREQLAGLEQQEVGNKKTFEEKAGRAANLEPLKIQLAQMEQMLQQMMRQLPGKTDMPDLIVDISQTALATGIVNELFKPGDETKQEFYAEKPIQLRMVGTYHQFGAFMSGVASLPRVVILTMQDISLKPTDKSDKNASAGSLTLEGTVKTYGYLGEDEQAAAAPPAPQPGQPAAAPAAGGK
ncbi:MAG: type 4a pilus biogenesis protein PilO [Proteobacteria bacterium]|nr:type 4a pilus biogenesis protein PilO [Pseudomonadota bacterium]